MQKKKIRTSRASRKHLCHQQTVKTFPSERLSHSAVRYDGMGSETTPRGNNRRTANPQIIRSEQRKKYRDGTRVKHGSTFLRLIAVGCCQPQAALCKIREHGSPAVSVRRCRVTPRCIGRTTGEGSPRTLLPGGVAQGFTSLDLTVSSPRGALRPPAVGKRQFRASNYSNFRHNLGSQRACRSLRLVAVYHEVCVGARLNLCSSRFPSLFEPMTTLQHTASNIMKFDRTYPCRQ